MTQNKNSNTLILQTQELGQEYDYLAPDNSEIRLLPEVSRGGLAHCSLPMGVTTNAVSHKTVEEIWYVLEGTGEIWRKNELDENIVSLTPGTSITIPVSTKFQFRNVGKDTLKILIVTMPPWPGKDEVYLVEGVWTATTNEE